MTGKTTRFCDVGLNLHTKLTICLLLLSDQSGEYVAKQYGLPQVSVYIERIENIYHFEYPLETHFQLFFGNIWKKKENYI